MDPSSEGGRMTWHDVAKRRTLLDFSSMNDFGEDVVTSSSVEYGRFQLGLFLSGVFIIALYVYAEFLHYMRIKRMHNSSYNKGLAEDSIEKIWLERRDLMFYWKEEIKARQTYVVEFFHARYER